MAADDAIVSISAVVDALEAHLIADPSLDVHLQENTLDTPADNPNGRAHKGIAVKVTSTRNLGISRNRDVARYRAVLVVTLTWRLSADQRTDRALCMQAAEAIAQRATTYDWNPGGVVDQIRHTDTTWSYHPTGRGWYVATVTLEMDYDTPLGDGV